MESKPRLFPDLVHGQSAAHPSGRKRNKKSLMKLPCDFILGWYTGRDGLGFPSIGIPLGGAKVQSFKISGGDVRRAQRVFDFRWTWVTLPTILLCLHATPLLAQCFEHQKLTASDRRDDERFARSISISGDLAVFGAAPSERAVVFRRNGTAWVEE